MDKKRLELLERAFVVELTAALGGHRFYMMQTKSKLAEKMVAEGYLAKCKENISGATVEGYKLTSVGHMTYCKLCEGKENG